MSKIEYYNEDCMIGMARYPDKYFDLAIVDPPYAVGASDGDFGGKSNHPSKIAGKLHAKDYANHDKVPDKAYFDELFRVSRNQIIWGANYYPQYLSHSGWVVWDKLTTGPLSDCELAYQSINKLVTKYTSAWTGFNKQDCSGQSKIRVHPNQKPVSLYLWLLTNYAKPGDKILDTHVGSASSLIACYDLGFDAVGFELDPDYYRMSKQRLDDFMRQPRIDQPLEKWEQVTL